MILTCLLAGCAGQRVAYRPVSTRPDSVDQRAVDRFVDGVISDINENYGAALLSYQEALLYDSTSASLYLAMARDYIRLGREESALVSLDRCLRLDRNNLEAMEILSQIYLAQKQWDRAESVFRDMLAIDSSYVEAYYHLANISLEQNHFDKAVTFYRRYLDSKSKPDMQVLLELGELFLENQKWQEAAKVYDQMIRANPQNGLGYYGLGITREAQGDTVTAMTSYRKALTLNPRLFEARSRMRAILQARGMWDEAIDLFQTAASLDSTDLGALLELSDLYRQTGDTTAYLETSHAIKDRFPEDWQVDLNLGRFYLDQQRFGEALTEFRHVASKAPNALWGWLFSGIALAHMDSLDRAEISLRKALQIVPAEPLGNYYLGSVLSQLQRPREALRFLETALQAQSDWSAALGALASVYDQLREYAISDSLFRRVLQLEPDNPVMLNNYSYSLSVRGDRLDEAMQMARRAIEQEPENGSYLDTIGWIYFQLGAYEKALEYIEKAADIRVTSAEVIEHLGDVYQKLNMHEKARSAWMRALDLDPGNDELRKKLDLPIED